MLNTVSLQGRFTRDPTLGRRKIISRLSILTWLSTNKIRRFMCRTWLGVG